MSLAPLLLKRPLGHAKTLDRTQLADQILGLPFAGQKVTIPTDKASRSFRIFLQQLHPKAAQSPGDKLIDTPGPGLGPTVEQGVPATDIGFENVQLPHPVA